MSFNFRFFLFIIFATVISVGKLQAQTQVIEPAQNHKAAFAIFVDHDTYTQVSEAVHAYRDMLESTENLSTYIVKDQWRNPMHVRKELMDLHAADQRIEGVVFVGDIPVAMVRQAQHMTTAFKMHEENFPRERSSVASDRFYDDFDLDFEYIGQDDERPSWHYYQLTENSSQQISSDVYSGRIRPMEEGRNPYSQIEDYLYKVIEDRRQQNELNHLLTFLGYGSNSECMVAWASERIALSQQFPQVNKPGNSFRFLNFGTGDHIKANLINELQREKLDLALLTKHGSVGIQHLSHGQKPTNDIRDHVERVRQSIYLILDNDTIDEQRENYARRMGIPMEWVKNTEPSDNYLSREELDQMGNIYVEDIDNMTANARLIILDACYNGSFHHPENIGSAYIFNPGNTIVTVGNSVNVLQDNYPYQYLGLLTNGVRIGHLRQHVNTLESHIIGDPTFRFFSSAGENLNHFIRENEETPEAWARLIHSDNPDMAAFALMMYSQANDPDYSDFLLETFLTSPEYTIRMESLLQLRRLNDQNYASALVHSVNDPYELVRRLGARWIGDRGQPEHLPVLVNMILNDLFYERAAKYSARSSLTMFDTDAVEAAIEKAMKERPNMVNREIAREYLTEINEMNRQRTADWLNNIKNTEMDIEKRIMNIRFIRNNPLHHHAGTFTGIAKDQEEPEKVRLAMIEALGWFTHSTKRERIIDACREIVGNTGNPDNIRAEAEKTIKRLTRS
ncbi:MAG: HEAT repeat domain-containing protein [Bacteroidales bacterium]